MRKKWSTESIITEFKKIHGDMYDYSKVEYTNHAQKICIIDIERNEEFWMLPGNHLNGSNNPSRKKNKKLTQESVLKKFSEVHGDLYDYSKVNYVNSKNKVCIIHPVYGEHWILVGDHFNGVGHPKHGLDKLKEKNIKNKISKEMFLERALKTHGNIYDYSKINYVDYKTKVLIIHPEFGEFKQTPECHVKGQGHPKAGRIKTTEKQKLSREEFIQRSKEKFKNTYDYSKINYVDYRTKVTLIHNEYGEFEITPVNHLLSRTGCNLHIVTKNVKLTLKDFIKKAKEVHGDLYDYSKVEYINNNTKICIIDPMYGEFWQTPNNHLNGANNPKRAKVLLKNKRTGTTLDFIKKAKEVHGDLYDYSKVEYINSNTKICIIDPMYGEFWQTPSSHLSGQGCPIRGVKSRSDLARMCTEDFIKKAKEVHGDLYDYSKVEYIGIDDHVCIIHPEYGEYHTSPYHHLKGGQHPFCRLRFKNKEDFIKKAKEVHGDLYDYSKVEYINTATNVCIIHPEYGEFFTTPYAHVDRKSGHSHEVGYTQQYAYINIIKDGDIPIAIKYGIEKNKGTRHKSQNKSCKFEVVSSHTFFFNTDGDCKQAEKECKKRFGKGVLTKQEMPDGYTETTTPNNIDKIIAIYEKWGGVKQN